MIGTPEVDAEGVDVDEAEKRKYRDNVSLRNARATTHLRFVVLQNFFVRVVHHGVTRVVVEIL